MKRLFYTIAAAMTVCVGSIDAGAQSLFPFIQEEILGNNPVLHSRAQSCESTKLDNSAGLTLANPEVSLSYMFGSPSDVPNKTNIGVSQTFDFPTLSGARSKVADASNAVADAAYMAERSQLALEVENALINYLYSLKLTEELDARMKARQVIQEVADKALEAGTLTYPDYNEIRLENITAENDLKMARISLKEARNQLVRLNGGKEPSRLPDNWPEALLPHSFDEWVETASAVSPELMTLRADMQLASRQVNLRKKEGLPEFSVGYVNELVKEGNYHGASLGFSLPLWGNSSRVKAAKASLAAARESLQSASENFRLTKLAEYEKAAQMLSAANTYTSERLRAVEHSTRYLDLALEKGTINRLDYLRTLDSYTDYSIRTLEAIRDFQLARAALYASTL